MPPAYATVVREDETPEGTPCFVAEHPELPGCVGYGPTIIEAEASLDRAREAYLHALGASAPAPGMARFGRIVLWSAVETVTPSTPDPAFV